MTARIDDGAFLIENVPAGRVGAAFELVAESIGTGEVAPLILVQTADGNAVMTEHLRGHTLIVAFSSLATMNDAAGVAQFEAIKAVRRQYANRKDLLILWR